MEEATRSEIAATMSKRLDCLAALVKLAEKQRDILMSGNHNSLIENLMEHDPLLAEIKQLEKREEILLSQLPENEQSPTAFETRLRAAISAEADRLYAVTTTNKQLMIRQMEFVNFTLGMIFRTASESLPPSAGSNPAFMIDSRV